MERNKYVILAEDDEMKAALIQACCRRVGLLVDHSVTRNAAIQLLRSKLEDGVSVDLVITDWNMPFYTDGGIRPGAGLAVVEECRRKSIPVVVCSGDIPEDAAGMTGAEFNETYGAVWYSFPRDVHCLNEFLDLVVAGG